jgi:hypothetical protein
MKACTRSRFDFPSRATASVSTFRLRRCDSFIKWGFPKHTRVLDGVSVIICTHNAATRLPTTLAHLKSQNSPNAPWEVLVIDNAYLSCMFTIEDLRSPDCSRGS